MWMYPRGEGWQQVWLVSRSAATIPPMDELVVALVSGLLGGGVSGALLGGYVTLRAQQRAFSHERQTRFIDLKRERYAALLRGSNDWVRLLNNQRAVARSAAHTGRVWDGKPELGETTELWHVAEEIALLDPAVGQSAREMVGAVIRLGVFAVDARDPDQLRDDLNPYWEAMTDFNNRRDAFAQAASTDLVKS
jgi:hypothetical protein